MMTFGSLVSEQKAEYYLEMGLVSIKEEDPYVGLAKGLSGRILFVLLCIGFVDYSKTENYLYNGVFNIFVFGIIIYAICAPINLVFSRLARPYEVIQILLIPLLYPLANKLQKLVIIIIILAFSFTKFASSMKGGEDIFIPYKTIFSN
jgi:hypothetical protein